MIVVGAMSSHDEQRVIINLAHRCNLPIIADVTSGLRFFDDSHIIHYADHVLLNPEFSSQVPDLIIQFGVRITSKRMNQFLTQRAGLRHILVTNRTLRHDPFATVTEVVSNFSENIRGDDNWKAWKEESDRVAYCFDAIFSECELTEPYVARAISKSDWSNRALFLSSSMPIRDMDMFAAPGRTIIDVASNRGVSGIDGVTSTACGYAQGLNKPTTLLIGDLAFLHDANGLSLLSKINIPVVIVVINNQGGGIFSFLPIAKSVDVFSEFFDTPHSYNLKGLSQTYGVRHQQLTGRQEFDEAYAQAISSGSHCVIEVKSNTQSNLEFHEYIKTQLTASSRLHGPAL